MKNTLAENMLRFGTKNLSELAKQRLTEAATPVQPMKESNPTSYTFKDDASWQAFQDQRNYKTSITPAMGSALGSLFFNYDAATKKYTTVKPDALPRVQFIALNLALIAAASGAKTVKGMGNMMVLDTYYAKGGAALSVNSTILKPPMGNTESALATQYGLVQQLKDPKSVYGKMTTAKALDVNGKDLGLTQWQYLVQNIITPAFLAIYNAYVIPAKAAPVTQPTPTAPVKKP
jgi:hypothetical protein